MDMGKLVEEAHNVDVPSAAELFAFYGEAIDKQSGEIAPTEPGNLALVTREPLGVIGAVTPWNFPLDLAVWKVAPALAAGNSVVLKPAEQAPLSSIRLAELAVEAGVPNGVLNVVPGLGPSAGEALGRHADVDVIAFTGSTETGKRFLRYAADSNAKQVWLECGGKSPNVVFDDADLDAAVDKAIFGAFYNQGAVCSSNSRLLLHAPIAEEFLSRLIEQATAITPGNPLDPASVLGAIVDEEHTQRVLGFIERARSQGRIVMGGQRETGRRARLLHRPDHRHRSGAHRRAGHRGGVRSSSRGADVRRRDRGRPNGQRHCLRPGCFCMDQRPLPGASRCGRAARGHGVGQYRRRAQCTDAVRRLQAIRVRTRPVVTCPRQVHRPQDHLDRILVMQLIFRGS